MKLTKARPGTTLKQAMAELRANTELGRAIAAAREAERRRMRREVLEALKRTEQLHG